MNTLLCWGNAYPQQDLCVTFVAKSFLERFNMVSVIHYVKYNHDHVKETVMAQHKLWKEKVLKEKNLLDHIKVVKCPNRSMTAIYNIHAICIREEGTFN